MPSVFLHPKPLIDILRPKKPNENLTYHLLYFEMSTNKY